MDIGDIIDGKYRILRLIGQGGMGVVYEVQHQIVGQKYALKCLDSEQAIDQAQLTRFVQEAQAAAAIGSEHIVYITDAGQTADGVPFLVMELLEGRDLRAVIQQEAPLQVERAIDLVIQVCDALEAAHGRGIVHRDIKPGNLFVTEHKRFGEKVKVLDFGVAKVRNPAAPDDPQLTTTGAPLGTPFYMAQEQFIDAKGVDQRADIYSVGMILFELLTGQRPYSADNYTALVIEVATGTPHRMTDFMPSLDPALDDIVLRAIARLPEERFQSITELADALEPYGGRATVDPVGKAPPSRAPQDGAVGAAAPVEQTMPLQQPQSAAGADVPAVDTPTTFPGDPNATPPTRAAAAAREEPPTPAAISFTSAPPRKRSRWPLFALAGGGLLVVLMAVAGISVSLYLSQQPEPAGGGGVPLPAAAATTAAPPQPNPPAPPPAPSPAPEPSVATPPAESPDAAVASPDPAATAAAERDAGAADRPDPNTPASPAAPATPGRPRPTSVTPAPGQPPRPTPSSRPHDIQRPASRPRYTPSPTRPTNNRYGRELDPTRPNYGSEL